MEVEVETMRNRGRGRGKGGRRLIQGVVGGKFTILVVTDSPDNPGNGYVTTAAPHGLDGSLQILISGTSGGLYDGGPFDVFSGTATSFTIGTPYVGNSSGGTWRLA